MLTDTDLDRLVAAMAATGTTTLTVTARRSRLHLELAPATAPEAGPGAAPLPGGALPAAPAPATIAIRSPGIGRFTPRGGADGLPPLTPGATVAADEIIGFVAQGPVRLAVASPAAGRLPAPDPLPAPDTLCGHGDILATLEPLP